MATAAHAVRMYEHGGPEVLRYEDIEVASPGPQEVRVRHEAIGLNFADTYSRTGLYPAKLPSGIGVEAAGVIVEVGDAVTQFRIGDRVTYTGSAPGAYSTERTMKVTSLIALPDSIPSDTAAAMTMRGLTSAYLLRRIWPLAAGDAVLFHAAAGGVGSIFTQWAQLLGIRVIGTVSNDTKAELARANGCTDVINSTTQDVAATVRELTDGAGVRVVYDGVGRATTDISLNCVARRGLLVCLGTASGPVRPIAPPELVMRGSLYVTRPALADYIANPAERSELVGELFDHVGAGRITVEINQRYRLADAAEVHRDLESRRTTGSSVFTVD